MATASRLAQDPRVLGWGWSVHMATEASKPDVFLLSVEMRGSRQALMASFYSNAARRIDHNLSTVVALPTLDAIARRIDEWFLDVEMETDDGE
jgi:hypothetical protein